MRFSRILKSSPHCLPSPDGRLIATLFSSVINVRLIETLEVVNVIRLPQDVSGPVLSFRWSSSSSLILVAVADQIHVFSALQQGVPFSASIRNAVPAGARPVFVGFGARDTQVCVCSSFGLKFALFDIGTSKAIEFSNPKFFSTAAACRSFSFRKETGHLALLTRASGKDMVSIHNAATREAQISFAPDTIDAQGVVWSPDGRWLVVWESAGQGLKVLLYTADGHIFKTWTGSHYSPADDRDDHALGAGVKTLKFSPDAGYLAIGDSRRCICILKMTGVSEAMRLQHPTTISPCDTLQVWQEQVTASHSGTSVHSFVRATHTIYPPARLSSDKPETKSGCSLLSFDSSSALLATKLEDSPSTIWIWDIAASELRAVILFHTDVSSLAWHPTIRESLLVRCDGSDYRSLAFVWDPLSCGPRSIDFAQQFPEHDGSRRSRCTWLNVDSQLPAIFFSNGEGCVLAALGGADHNPTAWAEALNRGANEDSPLELLVAGESYGFYDGGEEEVGSDTELDDTFHYKREMGTDGNRRSSP